jgi:hypothetical protein
MAGELKVKASGIRILSNDLTINLLEEVMRRSFRKVPLRWLQGDSFLFGAFFLNGLLFF